MSLRLLEVTLPTERAEEALAELVAHRDPNAFTTAHRRAKRAGRLYLDVGRNASGQTAVAPYAVRGRPGAPVATPLDWDELGGRDLGPRTYTMKNLFRRLGQRDDPWKGIEGRERPLGGARRALDALRKEEMGDGRRSAYRLCLTTVCRIPPLR